MYYLSDEGIKWESDVAAKYLYENPAHYPKKENMINYPLITCENMVYR